MREGDMKQVMVVIDEQLIASLLIRGIIPQLFSFCAKLLELSASKILAFLALFNFHWLDIFSIMHLSKMFLV